MIDRDKGRRISDEVFRRLMGGPTVRLDTDAQRAIDAKVAGIAENLRDAGVIDLNDPDSVARLTPEQRERLIEAVEPEFSWEDLATIQRNTEAGQQHRRNAEFLSGRGELLGVHARDNPAAFQGAKNPLELYRRMAAEAPEAFHAAHEDGRIGHEEYEAVLASPNAEPPDLDPARIEHLDKPLDEMGNDQLKAVIEQSAAEQHGVPTDD